MKRVRYTGKSVSSLVLDAYGAAPSEAFERFMSTRTDALSANDFVEMYEQVAHRREPIVRYAAGWMLIEAATIRRRRLEDPSENTYLLDEARRIWVDVGVETGALLWRGRCSQPEYERLLDLNWRIAMCSCFLPAFEAIGRSLDTGILPLQGYMDDTHEALLGFTQALLECMRNIGQRPDFARNCFRGIASELLVALFMHRTNRREVVVVPASLKYENFRQASLRVDLFSYDYRDGEGITKIPVQVKASGADKGINKTRTVLIYGSQMVLDGYDGSRSGRTAALAETLTALVAEYHGPADTREAERIRRRSRELDSIAEYISAEIAAFKFRYLGEFDAQPYRCRNFRPPWLK